MNNADVSIPTRGTTGTHKRLTTADTGATLDRLSGASSNAAPAATARAVGPCGDGCRQGVPDCVSVAPLARAAFLGVWGPSAAA